MASPPARPDEDRPSLPLVSLLPNLLTLAAVCAGMTAIRFGFQGEYGWAVRLILVAVVLDTLDGRLARLLRAKSLLGAELDSLADFLNFGVAPGLILYAWSLEAIGGLGWLACLGFALCCLMRLARFNVDAKVQGEGGPADHFVGVPSPAGAILVLLPLVVSLHLSVPPVLPAGALAAYTALVGFLMISRLPTRSFKNVRISRAQVPYVMLGAVLVVTALLIYTWATLIALTGLYVLGLVGSIRALWRPADKE